jgi:hypothetical protein
MPNPPPVHAAGAAANQLHHRPIAQHKLDISKDPSAASTGSVLQHPAPQRAGSTAKKKAAAAAGGPPRGPISPHNPDDALLRARYKPETVRRYLAGVGGFVHWCRDGGWPLRTTLDLDHALCQHIHHLWRSGGGRSAGVSLRCGVVMLLPTVDGKLPLTDRALTGWSKLMPTVSHAPISLPVAAAIATTLARNGHYRAALATLLAFYGWLRIGEVCGMIAADVADGRDPRLAGAGLSRVALVIRKAKTGNNQSVELKDATGQWVALALRAECKHDGELLMPGGAAAYRKAFHRACDSLGLGGLYVPHSLRHGGATRAYVSGMPIEDVMVYGRWAASKSARTYIQQSRALLLATAVPPAVLALGTSISERLPEVLAEARKRQ